jgi:peptidoglycan pentaglycine glycine transferase (the first glycine)
MPELRPTEWEDFLDQYPEAHLLQTGTWGELKSAFGWEVVHTGVNLGQENDAVAVGAQVLFRRLPFGLRLAYIPKGPVGGEARGERKTGWDALWPELDTLCHNRKAIFLKVEPDLCEPLDLPEGDQSNRVEAVPPGFNLSQQDIQPSRTLLVDLRGDEEQVLARMKQKTRYNIRLALKKGVVVSPSGDIDLFHRLMTVTGRRDVFGVHSLAYYRKAYELFHPRGECEVLLAGYQEEPLAALMVFAHGRRAWYLYGASSSEHRDRMPTYLLQWESMRWARSRGCTSYDLWGVPDVDEITLEANFTKFTRGLWGVYRFKRGFGGQLRRALGPWDRVYKPVWYAFYRWWAARRKLQ